MRAVLLAGCHFEANLHSGLNNLGGGLTKQRKPLTGSLLCVKDCRWCLDACMGKYFAFRAHEQTLQIDCVVTAAAAAAAAAVEHVS